MSRMGTIILLLMSAFCAAAQAQGQRWADWRTARPFVVRADFSLARSEPLLMQLQQLQQELTERLHIPPANEPIELYLFQTEAAYQAYLDARFPQAPKRRALFIKSGGPGQVYAYRSQQFEVDLRHETTHALLHASLAAVPLWLDEGLAEYFEVPSQDRLRNNPHLRGLKWNLMLGMSPGMSDLEQREDLSEMGQREYMFAWAYIHYMLHGPLEARQELIGYLQESQTGLPAQSLRQRLSRRMPDTEKRFVQHFISPSASKAWSG